MRLAVFCIFLIIIEGEPCNKTYSNTRIDYITNHLNDANSRSDVYNIYYLGTKPSATECLNSCIDFNYLCDKSLNNTYVYDDPQGSAIWDFNNSICSITMSVDRNTIEAYALVTPNITANEYILDLKVSLSTDSRDAGIAFKAKQYGYTSYAAYLNADENVVAYYYYTDHIDGTTWVFLDVETDVGAIDTNVIYDFQVHIIHDKYTLSLNGLQIYSETNSFAPEYNGANYAGIYINDNYGATTATFHSFKVRYPDSSDNDDAFVCASYVFNNINNDCFGYYGSDYNVIKDSISADATYTAGIVYDICPSISYTTNSPSEAPTKSPNKTPTKSPNRTPTKSPIAYHTEAPTRDPTQFPSREPNGTPTKAPIPTTDRIIALQPSASAKDLIPSIYSTNNIISTSTETKEDILKDAPEFLEIWWLWVIVIILFVLVILSGSYVFYVVQTRFTVPQNKRMKKEIEAQVVHNDGIMRVPSKSVANVDSDFKNETNCSTRTGFSITSDKSTTEGNEHNVGLEIEGANENRMVKRERVSLSEGPKQHTTRNVRNDAMIATIYEVETDNLDVEMIENNNIDYDEFIVCADDEEVFADTNTNLVGHCVDCASEDSGKMYDGRFYCNKCYHKYYL